MTMLVSLVVHTCNPTTWEAEARRWPQVHCQLVYKVSSRPSRNTETMEGRQKGRQANGKKKSTIKLGINSFVLK